MHVLSHTAINDMKHPGVNGVKEGVMSAHTLYIYGAPTDLYCFGLLYHILIQLALFTHAHSYSYVNSDIHSNTCKMSYFGLLLKIITKLFPLWEYYYY